MLEHINTFIICIIMPIILALLIGYISYKDFHTDRIATLKLIIKTYINLLIVILYLFK